MLPNYYKYNRIRSMRFLSSLLSMILILGAFNVDTVNAKTSYGFSDTNYENEVGERERTNGNKRRYPFIASNIAISTPRLQKTSSGQFQLVYQYGYPMTRGGAERFLEYRVKFSKDLEKIVSGISIDPVGAKADPRPPNSKKKYNFENRVGQDSDGYKVFSSGVYLGSGYNGGDANIYITLSRSFIPQNTFISSYMISSTEVTRPVYPSFEAVRILQYSQFGKQYNEALLKSEKDQNIDKLKKTYDDLIKKINDSSLSQKTKEAVSSDIKDILGKAVQKINSETQFENKTLQSIETIADVAIDNMNDAYGNLSEFTITSLPNLNFGVQLIQSKKTIYETVDDQVIKGLLVVMNATTPSNINVNLSISDLKSKTHTLSAMYALGNKLYKPNTAFAFISGTQRSGEFTLKRQSSEGVKLIVYPENVHAETYTGTATWSISKGPSN